MIKKRHLFITTTSLLQTGKRIACRNLDFCGVSSIFDWSCQSNTLCNCKVRENVYKFLSIKMKPWFHQKLSFLFFPYSTFIYISYMETLTFTSTSSESFPKRIRSASARLFSLNHNNNSKRISFLSNSETTTSILNPTKWFPRMRCRSASSAASSTSSVVFSSSSTTTASHHTILDHLFHNHHHHHHQHHSTAVVDEHVDHANNSLISLETVSSELEDLYRDAREEVRWCYIRRFTIQQMLIYIQNLRLNTLLNRKDLSTTKEIRQPLMQLLSYVRQSTIQWCSNLVTLPTLSSLDFVGRQISINSVPCWATFHLLLSPFTSKLSSILLGILVS